MKKLFISILLVVIISIIFAPDACAYSLDVFDDSLSELRVSLSDEALNELSELGFGDDPGDIGDLDLSRLFTLFIGELSSGLSGPLSACAVILSVIILSSLLEGYTFSLRYTETRDIMSVVTSLLIITILADPIATLIGRSADIMTQASSLMLLYIPVMIGIMTFSGHTVSSAGYYAAVMTASQVIARLSSQFISPLISAYFAIAASTGVNSAVKLRGICDMVFSFVKWTLTFIMAIFTAVLSLQAVISNAADTVASRAVRFTLSSFIPIIGSAISESYRTIQTSVDLLRSGVGVFVMIAVIITFMPVLLHAVLWLMSVRLSGYVATALGVESPGALLTSIGSVISVLIAVTVCVMTVFIISSGVILSVGGSS